MPQPLLVAAQCEKAGLFAGEREFLLYGLDWRGGVLLVDVGHGLQLRGRDAGTTRFASLVAGFFTDCPVCFVILGDMKADLGEIHKLGQTQTVAAGSYEDVLVIREWNPLEPDVVEDKYYAPDTGLLLELTVEGEDARVELIEYVPSG